MTAAWPESKGGCRSQRRPSIARWTLSSSSMAISVGQSRQPQTGRYFLLLMDDCSRYMWLQLLTSKDKAAMAIKKFKTRVKVDSGKKLCVLRTDRSGEFTSMEFAAYCADQGVVRHHTAPYSSQQNGVVERRNQTMVGMARSLMKAKGMPTRF